MEPTTSPNRRLAAPLRARLPIAGLPTAALLWVGLLLVGSLATATRATPQPLPESTAPAAPPSAMQDDAALGEVMFVDPQFGWAVGAHGTIWHTRDGGQSWERQPAPTTETLRGVWFLDRRLGFAVGGSHRPGGPEAMHTGVVLVTRDGGGQWKRLAMPFPLLEQVRFFSPEVGIVAGRGLGARPSGIYRTTDGGQSWQPLGDGPLQHWLAADFTSAANGTFVGLAGAMADLTDATFGPGAVLDPAGRTLRDLAFNRPDCVAAAPLGQEMAAASGWIVGDGGLVLHTTDHGASWEPSGVLPRELLADIDLLTVATCGPRVWLAGSPGSLVLHSPDNGQTWYRQPTGVRTPLRCLRFVDADHGWAVGDLGVILRTSDGGRTWQTVRGGGRRTAVLGLFASAQAVPCATLAQAALDEGYRMAVHLLADPDAVATAAEAVEPRLSAAIEQLGGHASSAAWQFVGPELRLGWSAPAAFAAIDRLNDGQASQRLQRDMVRQIRLWQPDVVLIPAPQATPDRPLDGVLHRLAIEALREAADPTAAIDLATLWHLPPWQVRRALATLPPGSRGTHHIAIHQLSRRLQQPLAHLARPGRGLLQTTAESAPATEEFLQVLGATAGSPDDLFADLAIAAGSASRRVWEPRFAGDGAAAAQRQQLQHRNLLSLLQTRDRDPGWIAQATRLASQLDAADGAPFLDALAHQYLVSGEVPLAAEIRELLVRRYPDHPLAETSALWLAPFYASSETAYCYASRAHALAGGPARGGQAGTGAPSRRSEIQLAAAEAAASGLPASPQPAGRNLDRALRLERAVEFTEWLGQRHPLWYEQPSLRFPWAVAQRERGFPGTAERYLLTLERRQGDNPWQACAAAERWLREPSELPPALPLVTCRRAGDRPVLDGRFDDPLWQSAAAARLRVPRGGPADERLAAESEIRLAYDADYLYVAIRCPQVPDGDYRSEPGARPQDADLRAHDRVRLVIDLDRDYRTWFELEIDARGFTADRCWGDASWNPQWFVAAGVDIHDPTNDPTAASAALRSQRGGNFSGQRGHNPADTAVPAWQAEIAIAWEELADQPPASRNVWAVAIERIAPGVGFQTLAGPAAETPSPANFGLLLFE